ncbi:MAG: hypothetical protein HQ478_15125 [Chloroflexi bacterium]|nr:hypothetical protein [Chloroflexota bacterium]
MDTKADAKLVSVFIQVEVADLDNFKAAHRKTAQTHRELGLSEAVFQSTENPNKLTMLLSGTANTIERWMSSEERRTLAGELQIIGSATVWQTTELYPMGTYE